jgi:hypothetical protein
MVEADDHLAGVHAIDEPAFLSFVQPYSRPLNG